MEYQEAPEILFSIISFWLSLLTLATGWWFKFKPPKNINWFYGFRTKLSMKTQQHWDYAHQISGQLFMKFGFLLLLIAIIDFFANFFSRLNAVFLVIITIVIFLLGIFIIINKTNKAVYRKFEKNS